MPKAGRNVAESSPALTITAGSPRNRPSSTASMSRSGQIDLERRSRDGIDAGASPCSTSFAIAVMSPLLRLARTRPGRAIDGLIGRATSAGRHHPQWMTAHDREPWSRLALRLGDQAELVPAGDRVAPTLASADATEMNGRWPAVVESSTACSRARPGQVALAPSPPLSRPLVPGHPDTYDQLPPRPARRRRSWPRRPHVRSHRGSHGDQVATGRRRRRDRLLSSARGRSCPRAQRGSERSPTPPATGWLTAAAARRSWWR